MKNHVLAVLLLAVCAAPVAAQTTELVRIRQESSDKQSAEQAALRDGQMRIVGKMRERMPVETRTTVGAPYSAEAVTESTQVLSDGNRINHKVTTRVYRDSEGRTRRDQIGENGAVESTFIVDPQTGTNYVFELGGRESVAKVDTMIVSRREGPPPVVEYKVNAGAFAEGDVVDENRTVTGMKADAEARAKTEGFMIQRRASGDGPPEGQTVREDLGTSTIEGLAATGSLTTTTIPAGAIGNLQPLKVVSEEWFSSDLKVLVLTKHSDPRTGDTVYRLVNIVRAEPDASLFVAPEEQHFRKSGIRNPEEGAR